jgi:ketosteroid isomerase-like protein
MITPEWARSFAQEWIEAWNAHDLDRILAHYTEDFEMSSPFIAKFTQEPSGTLKGREQVGAYWRTALERIPDLRFELIEVFTCVDSLTIYYKAVLGKLGTEVLFVDASGRAYKALAHYND